MTGAGYVTLTRQGCPGYRGDSKLVLAIDAIELVEDLTPYKEMSGSFVRTLSGECIKVREPYEPLAAMLLERGRELSPAEEAAIRERVLRGDGC